MSGHSQRSLTRSRQFALLAVRNAAANAQSFGSGAEEVFWSALSDLIEGRFRSLASDDSPAWREFEAYLIQRLSQ